MVILRIWNNEILNSQGCRTKNYAHTDTRWANRHTRVILKVPCRVYRHPENQHVRLAMVPHDNQLILFEMQHRKMSMSVKNALFLIHFLCSEYYLLFCLCSAYFTCSLRKPCGEHMLENGMQPPKKSIKKKDVGNKIALNSWTTYRKFWCRITKKGQKCRL